jgi:hypothetical protein
LVIFTCSSRASMTMPGFRSSSNRLTAFASATTAMAPRMIGTTAKSWPGPGGIAASAPSSLSR